MSGEQCHRLGEIDRRAAAERDEAVASGLAIARERLERRANELRRKWVSPTRVCSANGPSSNATSRFPEKRARKRDAEVNAE
jgi:SLT domain-containing protein